MMGKLLGKLLGEALGAPAIVFPLGSTNFLVGLIVVESSVMVVGRLVGSKVVTVGSGTLLVSVGRLVGS